MAMMTMVLQSLLALVFLLVGVLKIVGMKRIVNNFTNLYRYPRWFVTVTGLVELIGAIGMLVGIWYPALAVLAGVWLGFTMLVGAWTHLVRVHESIGSAMPTIILCLLSVAVIALNWPSFMHLVTHL